MKKIISSVMVALILISTLTVVFNIKQVNAWSGGTIYLHADGSISPPDAPIVSYDSTTYTLIDNIISSYHGIVVYRSNIVIDGNGYMLQGSNIGRGVAIYGANNVTLKNLNIKGFGTGILIESASYNTIYKNKITNNDPWGINIFSGSNNDISENQIINNYVGINLRSGNKVSENNITGNSEGIRVIGNSNDISRNKITNNGVGITLSIVSNNNIRGNDVIANSRGICLYTSTDNKIWENNIIANNLYGIYVGNTTNNFFYHNNIIDNAEQVRDDSWYYSTIPRSVNIWDDGYPSGGNYWSDYTGVDEKRGPNQDQLGSDGIGDTPYIIDSNNIDHYPLIKPWSPVETWSFDNDFQYNLDDNYSIVEGSGHIHGTATLSGSDLLIGGEVSISGQVPGQIPTVYLIATDGLIREYAKQIVDLSQFTYSQTAPNIYTFQGKILNAIKPVNNGHYEVEALITYNNQQYEFFINTSSRINKHYLPLTTLPAPENLPPTCIIKLQKDGVEISEVDVGEFFDIYVGDSTDDTGITQVRFSSDDVQDGIPTGEWTKWYNWGVSEGDWSAETKIKRWSFATYGPKEVWVEIKDTDGNINKSRANIFSGWAFALITDLHIGRGYSDYGGKGIYLPDDSQIEGQNYYLTDRLNKIVDWIIENQGKYNFKFVIVLGDISDSGEYSELKRAKDILDRLNEADIPYFPVIGNHDVWPYTQDEEAENLRYFEYFFKPQFEKLAQDSRLNFEFQPFRGEFINYRFSYKGLNFAALDFNSREHAIGAHGVKPGAELHEVTLAWLDDSLKYYQGQPVILLSHHPMIENSLLQLFFGADLWKYVEAFSSVFDDVIPIEGIINENKVKFNTRVLANFAGHVHGWSNVYMEQTIPIFMDANVNYKEKGFFTPAGIPVITTEAAMVASNEPTPKNIIRIVKVEGEKIDFDTLDGEFRALNPCFQEVDVELRPTLKWPPWKWVIEVEAYAFTKRFSEEYPGTYILYVDGVKVGEIQSKKWYSGVQFEFDYKGDKNYDLSLIVKGYTFDGREEILESINQTLYLRRPSLITGAFSPVDIVVTDPNGLIISKQINEISGAVYIEDDFNGDGEPDDIIIIPDRKIGDYFISVIPEPGAALTDIYTLLLWPETTDEPCILAKDVQISNIPIQPYIVRSSATEVLIIFPATVNFDPDSLNLNSKGNWITGCIELPEGFDVGDINVSTILLNNTIPVDVNAPIAIGDYDNDSIPDMMVKFDRAEVVSYILANVDLAELYENRFMIVTLTIRGKLNDGTPFQGSCTIRIILPIQRCGRLVQYL